ncbi:MAG: SLBB domain-containing protein [Betaproteobacteria bacterium]
MAISNAISRALSRRMTTFCRGLVIGAAAFAAGMIASLAPLNALAQGASAAGGAAAQLMAPMLAPALSSGATGASAIQGAGSAGAAAEAAATARPAASANAAPGSPEDAANARRAAQAPTAPEARFAVLEASEFQTFIAQSTGRMLPRYGANLFDGAPSTFAPVENIPMTPDYVIGPGDEIRVRVWGQIEADHRLLVDRNGNVSIPRIGNVPVAGVAMRDLQGHIKSAIERNFRNFELNVSLGQLRSIQIFVVGQARRPGSYTVSSLSTLVTALFASGGPSATGSMRRVQLKRADKVVTEFDVYDFVVRGDKSKDVRLLAGDVIFIPPEGALVAVSGSVKTPAIYELKETGTLKEVIELAGGLTTTAGGQKVLLERIENRKARQVDEFALTDVGLARKVKDGDLISVLAVSPKFENVVTLRGNVAMPLRYPYTEGMRISDLIPERNALIVADYYVRRNQATRIEVKGENQFMTEIQRTSAEINWEYAMVERLNPADLTTQLLPFNLGKAVIDRDPSQNLLLRAGDLVTVFSKNDFAVPLAQRNKLVILESEFQSPGVYKAEPGETLRQLVARTGGLSPNAYLFGAVFTRESTKVQQQAALTEMINRLEADLERGAVTRTQNAAFVGETDSLQQQIAAQKSTIARLRTLKATGRIVLNLPDNAKVNDLPDLPLENGDRFLVPSAPATVDVLGSVYSAGSFVFKPGQRVADYLRLAGGPIKAADIGATYVLRADGSVTSRRQSGWVFGTLDGALPMPGDTIVVPEDFERVTWTKVLKDYGQILYQFGLGAAAIQVLKN